MITAGAEITLLRDDKPPLKSPNTKLIAAAITCGFEFAHSEAMLDTIQQTDSGPKRQVTWSMNGGKKADIAGEEVSFVEFRKRYESMDWCKANPNSPIAYLRFVFDNYERLRDKLRDMKPLALIKRGNRIALIPADADAATREKILCRL